MIPDYSEADTKAKLIDKKLYDRGWTEDNITREENAGGLYKVKGKVKRDQKKVDYVMRVKVGNNPESVAVALIEAKKNTLPPGHGLQQAKEYAKRLNVPFIYSSNGYLFVEYDDITGQTSTARDMAEFPSPYQLRKRYETAMGFSLDDEAAKPLLMAYQGGQSVRRYYQDAAVRAVLEKIAAGGNRALLSLATGSGKTRIAIYLLQRIADAGKLGRVLFVCDRTELRDQAETAFQNVFGNNAQVVTSKNPQKNARILIATYQTLDVDSDDDTANFFIKNYPPNYFSHIIIDECHRSAWGKWRIVLENNLAAIQIGLTATPRQLETTDLDAPGVQDDLQITADNVAYFGEPVYEYTMSQGIADGYLAFCEVQKSSVNLDNTGLTDEQIMARNPVDAVTGAAVPLAEVREVYLKTSFEKELLLPDRVWAMSQDLFKHLLNTDGPEQKTIIFCVSDRHCDLIVNALNNLYSQWCAKNKRPRKDDYAFKCTASVNGSKLIPDFRGSGSSHFVAATYDLLSTGVDVPRLNNVVFFRYLKSPISFYQMVGRGTRIFPPTNKLMFRVYDYTDATTLFGEKFITTPSHERLELIDGDDLINGDDGDTGGEGTRVIEVQGFEVNVNNAGRFIVDNDQVVTVEEYKEVLSARLVERAADLPAFREVWVDPDSRRTLLQALPANGQAALLVRELESMEEYDLFDVLAQLGYGLAPRTMPERAAAFTFKQATWLKTLPQPAAKVITALAGQFAQGGTNELESLYIWQTPEVKKAGGLKALTGLGRDAADLLRDTKIRIFAA